MCACVVEEKKTEVSSQSLSDCLSIYFTSDLHVDHHVLRKGITIQKYCNDKLVPADVLCVAGDTSDNPQLFVDFYREVSSRYKKVFTIWGNHDLTVAAGGAFPCNPFLETERKLLWLRNELEKLPNVTILDGITEEYRGIRFGGAMGFCDFSYGRELTPPIGEDILQWLWRYRWFDGSYWQYLENNPQQILESERRKLTSVLKESPDVMMTHYLPLAFGVVPRYRNSRETAFFYFDETPYLPYLKPGMIWHGGHVHSIIHQTKILSAEGRMLLFVNPVGYPGESIGNQESLRFLTSILDKVRGHQNVELLYMDAIQP